MLANGAYVTDSDWHTIYDRTARADNLPIGQAPWADDYLLADYPGEIFEDGVGALIDVVTSSETPVTESFYVARRFLTNAWAEPGIRGSYHPSISSQRCFYPQITWT